MKMNADNTNIKFQLSPLSIICLTLQVVFLVLQLTGVIAWPWICVFIPLLVIAGICILDVILILILYGIVMKE